MKRPTRHSPKPKGLSENLRRLRYIQATEVPLCCGKPMEAVFLNFGEIKDEDQAALSEQAFADYLCAQPLAPVFSCSTCHKEKEIPGLAWPDSPKAVN